jgi:hypothetical protein
VREIYRQYRSRISITLCLEVSDCLVEGIFGSPDSVANCQSIGQSTIYLAVTFEKDVCGVRIEGEIVVVSDVCETTILYEVRAEI